MSVKCVPPQTPLLYNKTGVCRVYMYLFFLFLFQNIDVPTIYVLSKNEKKSKIFPVKIFIFTTKFFSVYCMVVFS